MTLSHRLVPALVVGACADSVVALAEEWSGKVEFAWGPEVMEYGMREFGIKDPNGYYLAFTEPARA